MNSDTFLTDILKERLQGKAEPLPGEPPSVAHALVERVLAQAERGNVDAMSLIWDRVEGSGPIAMYPAFQPQSSNFIYAGAPVTCTTETYTRPSFSVPSDYDGNNG